ncbi:MAG: sodium:proton antiporter [Gammaproteobacteria bacterium]|nr:sodium:proton antiporter [Gammaproteobacteria bacterium]
MEHHGLVTLVPTALVLTLAIITRRSTECLLMGVVTGLAILDPATILGGVKDAAMSVMTNQDVAWTVLVCGLMGGLIGLWIRSGAIAAFTEQMTRYVHSRAGALTCAWVLGIFLFVDDYLSSLSVGASMRRVTDRFKISREMLAYVVDSTAAPVSVIIPISTWAVFFGGLLEANKIAADGQGVAYYISAIPYMFYAWVAVFMMPLVIWGKMPLFGPMSRAEARAAAGRPVPPGAEHLEQANQSIVEGPDAKPRVSNFLIPLATLVFFTWYFEIDFLKGLFVTIVITVAMLIGRKTLGFNETFDTFMEGIKLMIAPLSVLIAAFMFKEVNDALGLAPYVIENVKPLMTPTLLPMVVFTTMGLVSFTTGSNWGVFVIILPIVSSLAIAVGADMVLVVGATLSASTFGSHACLYSDATVLSAQASGCTSFQHAITQLPLALVAAAVAALGYLLIA